MPGSTGTGSGNHVETLENPGGSNGDTLPVGSFGDPFKKKKNGEQQSEPPQTGVTGRYVATLFIDQPGNGGDADNQEGVFDGGHAYLQIRDNETGEVIDAGFYPATQREAASGHTINPRKSGGQNGNYDFDPTPGLIKNDTGTAWDIRISEEIDEEQYGHIKGKIEKA